ncbi:hypothetical protein DQ04_01921070 [Trypanosoma grayi]|uniref:hypothetical protein n=1 Tax=Trypanosoma grayi TaxID=71804 RepID=UPI0004F40245|nr:hypothetical protein DQ04_01921070 [Trypanosoma grayi]KEG12184.1 hypothetical protein DQ04_01921070 [Trypanosoma grayi]
MNLVEREVEGVLCGALLAPDGWALRLHHDACGSSSLSVAHFERVDVLGESLYVAEHFVPRAVAGDAGALQKQLQERLLACVSPDSERLSRSPFCVVWEVERTECAAVLLEQYTLLVCVLLHTAKSEETTIMKEAFHRIVPDLKARYARLSKEVATRDAVWTAGVGGMYTPRGRCVVQMSQHVSIAAQCSPASCERSDWLLQVVATELGLVSEHLCLAVHGFAPVVVATLPLSTDVCLVSRRALGRVWARHVRRSGWRCAEVRRVRATIENTTTLSSSASCVVSPCSTFYYLEKDDSKAERVIAWVTEPRVGSDCCVVLLTPAAEVGNTTTTAIDNNNNHVDIINADTCQAQCEWLLSAFRLSIATTASFTALSVRKDPGFLFRQGSLVVHLPSASKAYTNATAFVAAAFSGASLGAVTVTAEDMGDGQRRQAVITLLKDYRCPSDYVDYIVTEYLYDTPLEKRSAVFRKRRRQQAVLSRTKQGALKEEEYSLWIRLCDSAAVYFVVRECGVGRLLLTQACVLGAVVDDAQAERWEVWVSGIHTLAAA